MRFVFANWQFLLLLPLLPLFFILRRMRIFSRGKRISYPAVSSLIAAGMKSDSMLPALFDLLRFVAMALIVIALARPQLGREVVESEEAGIDIFVALDLSSSMEALDFKIAGKQTNRLAVVKNVTAEFVGQRRSDRIGIVAFAGRAYLVSPLTTNHDYLIERIGELYIGAVEDGTAIGSAINSCAERLRKSEAKSKAIILVTDGVNNAGKTDPLLAAEVAKALGIKIYAIGVGTKGYAQIPDRNFFGQQIVRRQKVDIDEETLRKVSKLSGGDYFRATNTDSLAKIYEQINQLEKNPRKIYKFAQVNEKFMLFIIAALIIIVIEFCLRYLIRPVLP